MQHQPIIIGLAIVAAAVLICGVFFYRAVLRMMNRDHEEPFGQ